MAIPITIEKLLNESIVEWARIELKKDVQLYEKNRYKKMTKTKKLMPLV